jgi:uncharacterized membrane protein
MILFGGILVVIAIGTYEAIHAQFTNEYLKLGAIIVALLADAIGIHVIVHAVQNRIEVGERFIISNSFGFHSCNADPTHCFVMNGNPMPICARHLGLYGTLAILGISTLLLPSFWITCTKFLPWNVSLAIFFVLLIIVIVEGGLGKAGNIKQTNSLRCVGGILSALGWLFFAFFSLAISGLELGV